MIDTNVKIYFAIKSENKEHNIDFFRQKLMLEPTHFQQMYEHGLVSHLLTNTNG
ncbi:MAG: hypothetical protein KAH20_15260 [Methylococcales bacterium]|nr:hypothetical protein [Methylococcales bacterium]